MSPSTQQDSPSSSYAPTQVDPSAGHDPPELTATDFELPSESEPEPSIVTPPSTASFDRISNTERAEQISQPTMSDPQAAPQPFTAPGSPTSSSAHLPNHEQYHLTLATSQSELVSTQAQLRFTNASLQLGGLIFFNLVAFTFIASNAVSPYIGWPLGIYVVGNIIALISMAFGLIYVMAGEPWRMTTPHLNLHLNARGQRPLGVEWVWKCFRLGCLAVHIALFVSLFMAGIIKGSTTTRITHRNAETVARNGTAAIPGVNGTVLLKQGGSKS